MSNLVTLISKMGRGLTYSTQTNSFLTTGYTSLAGNTYFGSIRVSKNLIIKEDVGQGYAHAFLNGISIYNKQGVLIAEGRFHCLFYSLETVVEKTVSILTEAMAQVAQRNNFSISKYELTRELRNEMRMAIQPNSQNHLRLLIGK